MDRLIGIYRYVNKLTNDNGTQKYDVVMGLTMEVLIVTMKKGEGDKCGSKNLPTIRLQMTTLIKLLLVEATVSCLTWRVVFFIHYLLPVLRRAVSLIRYTELANRGCTSQWIN